MGYLCSVNEVGSQVARIENNPAKLPLLCWDWFLSSDDHDLVNSIQFKPQLEKLPEKTMGEASLLSDTLGRT